MKVLILGFTKISYMPYMHFYLEQFRKNNCEVHLLYWKRDGNPDTESPNDIKTHIFERHQEDTVPLRNKVGSFLGYRKYALQVLNTNNFDFIVVLHSTPGVLLFDVLSKKYKGRYILDYRDFTYENINIYKKVIHKLVSESYTTFVSSDAYRKYLPQDNHIYTSHNIIRKSIENKKIRREKSRESNPIRIRFWGFIRHESININIIEKLANDKRFELHYHGRGQKIEENLKQFCEKNKVKNVYFHGEYKPMDRLEFIENTDLIHNIYENDIKTINAMGNKYYDGVIFSLPQLCNNGSYMGEQVSKNGVGIMLDPDSLRFADEIWKYYKSINWTTFNTNCDKTLNEIILQYNDGVKTIEKIIEGKRVD